MVGAYTSGKFCIIGHTTRKALRIYGDMELLIPEWIDPQNGYKYYASKQVEKIIRINEYKEFGFSLKDISEICDCKEIFALYKEVIIKTENVGEVVGKLYEICSKGYEKAGPHFILYGNYENEHEEIKMKVGLPIFPKGNYEDELLHIKNGKYLKTIHKGGFSKIGLAYAALFDYADKNNIKFRKTAIERYVSFKEVEVCYEVEA